MVDRWPVSVLGIDHVQVAAPRGCEAEARAFYGDLLGLEELPKPEPLRVRGGCWFRAGGQELHVGVEEPFAPARKAHPGLVVSGLDRLAGRLAGAGITVAWDDTVPGLRRFHTADPFGNRLEFRES
jgi:catechol 2,3-dioxygenase-like lactoylglutathione lyase family enzyme